MDLSKFSIQQLQAELKRREQQDLTPPEPVANPDFKALVEMVQDELKRASEKSIAEGENIIYIDDDFDHYVFEAAMLAIYGPDFFEKWWNKRVTN